MSSDQKRPSSSETGRGLSDEHDGFDVCPEPTCPLYGKAVMADHRHLDTPAARRRREAEGRSPSPRKSTTGVTTGPAQESYRCDHQEASPQPPQQRERRSSPADERGTASVSRVRAQERADATGHAGPAGGRAGGLPLVQLRRAQGLTAPARLPSGKESSTAGDPS